MALITARKFGRAYELISKGHKALDMAAGDALSWNEEEMSVTATISTEVEDRERDVLLSSGVILDDYAANPVVLWDHGLTLELPVGTSRKQDKSLAVDVKEDSVVATCYFSKTLREARQIFDLIGEGVLKATSVGWNAVEGEASVRAKTPPGRDRPGLLVKQWHLLEWSFVPVGANQEALVKALDKPRIGGTVWSLGLRDSLKHYLPQTRLKHFHGWKPPIKTELTMPSPSDPKAIAFDSTKFSKEAAIEWLDARGFKSANISSSNGRWVALQVDQLPDGVSLDEWEYQGESHVKALLPASPKLKRSPAGIKASRRKSRKGEDEIPEETEETIEDELEKELHGEEEEVLDEEDVKEEDAESVEPADNAPLGQQVLEGVHANLDELQEQLETVAAPVENPVVKETVEQVQEVLATVQDQVEGTFAEAYPEATKLARKFARKDEHADESELEDEEGAKGEHEEEEEEEKRRKFYAPLTKAGRQGAMGTAAWLRQIAKTKKLPASVRRQAAQHAKSLNQTLAVVKNGGSSSERDLRLAVKSLKAGMAEMSKQFEESVPYKG